MTIKVSLVQPTLGLNDGSVVRERIITLNFCSKIVVEGSTVGQSVSWNDIEDKPSIPSIDGLASENYVDEAIGDIDIPESLPNPHSITINGTSYDGSSAVNVTIDGGSSVVNVNLTPFFGEQSGTMSAADYNKLSAALTSLDSVAIQGYHLQMGLIPVMLVAGNDLVLSANLSTLSEEEDGVVEATHLVVHISSDYSWVSSLGQCSLIDKDLLADYIDDKVGDINLLLDELNGEEI